MQGLYCKTKIADGPQGHQTCAWKYQLGKVFFPARRSGLPVTDSVTDSEEY